MQTKKDFEYARLLKTEELDNKGEPIYKMGPETAKRLEENDEDVAVTICCITYKHEEYIRDALDSFLMQKTNFKYKIFVGEDKGPDGTADIVREYAEKYPDKIVAFLREENMGAQANLIDLCNHAKSPYIAFCEGDDYWVDEYKLQKQYDLMQKNPDWRVCYTKAEISAPDDWFLRDWFKADKQGRLIFPDCEPFYKPSKKPIDANKCIWVFPAHTATVFYRWNYDLKIQDWYYTGIVGDHPIFLMQLGEGLAGMLPEVTAVYRRSNVGVYMSDDMDEHFMKTRIDHVRWMSGMLKWYRENLEEYPEVALENRIKHETYNFLRTAVNIDDYEAILEYFNTYPEEAKVSLNAYLSFYSDSRALVKTATWHGYQLMVRHRFYRQGLKVYSWFLKAVDAVKELFILLFKVLKAIKIGICYWTNSLVPKKKNLWVITGFRRNAYMDNTKYFYEYICENHPEIDVRFITADKDIYKELAEKDMPVCLEGTREQRKILRRAQIAVTDHFAMSDYKTLSGFNNRTKVVQLWHGVGFKSMGDKDGVRNTDEWGVRRCGDILIKKGDNLFVCIFKKIKYFFLAPFRELFENYFLFVCPGQERLDMIADVWNIDHDRCFMAGHPRDLPVYTTERQQSPVKVMYAPTYRFDSNRESDMVSEFLESAGKIQKLMEKVNGEFYLRMHPHTWRNYKGRIRVALRNFDRVFMDSEKDIYSTLGTFSVVVSDYSSIALDFALLDRPVVFHGSDYDWFVENEAGFNLDFPSVIPGPMTNSWDETIEKIEEYIASPQKDSELRKEKCKYFFDSSVNDPDNSKRIVEEIKRRIGI